MDNQDDLMILLSCIELCVVKGRNREMRSRGEGRKLVERRGASRELLVGHQRLFLGCLKAIRVEEYNRSDAGEGKRKFREKTSFDALARLEM